MSGDEVPKLRARLQIALDYIGNRGTTTGLNRERRHRYLGGHCGCGNYVIYYYGC